MKPRTIKGFGWIPDHPDHRDKHFKITAARRLSPPVVDLRQWCPPPMDQGRLGSCTANGITGIIRYALMKEGHPDRPMSRLQLYWDERFVEGTVKEDAGAEIRDGIKCAADNGVAPEPLWPYNIDRFKQQPFKRVYERALQFRVLTYERVEPHAESIKSAIASGFPVVGGFNVFEQFVGDQCARDGVVTMPGANEAPIGGHCIYFPGYGQRSGYITGRNSWGSNWGDKGDCYIPEAFLEQQGSDFWIVTKADYK